MLNRIDELKANISKLNNKDSTFAQSLIDQWTNKQFLSEKQLYYVDLLATEAVGIPDFSQDTGTEWLGVLKVFEGAGAKLQYPMLTVQLPGTGHIVTLTRLLRKENKQPWVKIGGKFSTVMGMISTAGELKLNRFSTASQKVVAELKDTLRSMMDDPAGFAAAQGKLTGKCIACHSPLSDKKSLAAGYGKTCAAHWGWPYGAKV